MGRLADLLTTTIARVSGDRGALADVDAKARQALAGHLRTRRALALAIAAEAREGERRQAMRRRVEELETRAVAAIAGGREDLAVQASEAIASLEAEVAASAAAMGAHSASIARLKQTVDDQRRRLADVERGRRLAVVRAALGETSAAAAPGTGLAATEAALKALEVRQADAAAVAADVEAADPESDGRRLAAEMADAGFGPALRPRSQDVLERLRARAALEHDNAAGPTGPAHPRLTSH